MPIQLVLADDHPLILDSLAYIFSQTPDIEVVRQCADGAAAMRAVRQLRPDVALLDIRMPMMSGLEVARKIREEKLPTRIILFAAELEPDEMIEAASLGVEGIVLKDEAHQVLAECIRTVHAGTMWMEPRSAMSAMEKLIRQEQAEEEMEALLSHRENELLRMVAQGLQNVDIADRLFISELTVRTHLKNIYKKLNLDGGRITLMRYLHEKGLM